MSLVLQLPRLRAHHLQPLVNPIEDVLFDSDLLFCFGHGSPFAEHESSRACPVFAGLSRICAGPGVDIGRRGDSPDLDRRI
jgi:hypothetical protein